MSSTLFLIVSLGLILLAAEGFTNGLEVFGKRFSFSQAVVGSILAAVGTAMPETILPLVAIFGSNHAAARDIGVGAILGAPFMLATVAFFLVGVTVVVETLRNRRKYAIRIEPHTLKRDLSFFIVMYALAIGVPLVSGRALVVPLALLLLAGYIFYVKLTVSGESAEMEHHNGLHLWHIQKRLGLTRRDAPHTLLIMAQVAAALLVMVGGANLFVKSLEVVSVRAGMSPLLFALILAPIATELPEKFNSVTWILKGKDPLAMGNVTGAMVFQATFPVSIGLLFTPWQITGLALFSALLALASALLLLAVVWIKNRVPPGLLLVGGVFYAIYVTAILVRCR